MEAGGAAQSAVCSLVAVLPSSSAGRSNQRDQQTLPAHPQRHLAAQLIMTH